MRAKVDAARPQHSSLGLWTAIKCHIYSADHLCMSKILLALAPCCASSVGSKGSEGCLRLTSGRSHTILV